MYSGLTAVQQKLTQYCESRSVVSDSLQPHGLYSPWNSSGWNTGVGSHSLLQQIFPTQELNWGLMHCRQIFYQLRICLLCKKTGFDPWVGKICWRRESLPTPVFWPGEFHKLYSPCCCKELDTTE